MPPVPQILDISQKAADTAETALLQYVRTNANSDRITATPGGGFTRLFHQDIRDIYPFFPEHIVWPASLNRLITESEQNDKGDPVPQGVIQNFFIEKYQKRLSQEDNAQVIIDYDAMYKDLLGEDDGQVLQKQFQLWIDTLLSFLLRKDGSGTTLLDRAIDIAIVENPDLSKLERFDLKNQFIKSYLGIFTTALTDKQTSTIIKFNNKQIAFKNEIIGSLKRMYFAQDAMMFYSWSTLPEALTNLKKSIVNANIIEAEYVDVDTSKTLRVFQPSIIDGDFFKFFPFPVSLVPIKQFGAPSVLTHSIEIALANKINSFNFTYGSLKNLLSLDPEKMFENWVDNYFVPNVIKMLSHIDVETGFPYYYVLAKTFAEANNLKNIEDNCTKVSRAYVEQLMQSFAKLYYSAKTKNHVVNNKYYDLLFAALTERANAKVEGFINKIIQKEKWKKILNITDESNLEGTWGKLVQTYFNNDILLTNDEELKHLSAMSPFPYLDWINEKIKALKTKSDPMSVLDALYKIFYTEIDNGEFAGQFVIHALANKLLSPFYFQTNFKFQAQVQIPFRELIARKVMESFSFSDFEDCIAAKEAEIIAQQTRVAKGQCISIIQSISDFAEHGKAELETTSSSISKHIKEQAIDHMTKSVIDECSAAYSFKKITYTDAERKDIESEQVIGVLLSSSQRKELEAVLEKKLDQSTKETLNEFRVDTFIDAFKKGFKDLLHKLFGVEPVTRSMTLWNNFIGNAKTELSKPSPVISPIPKSSISDIPAIG